jgi:hypothetical protein
MKRKKKSRHATLKFLVEDNYIPDTYLRLCHRCLFLNEDSKYIEKCSRCESQFLELSSDDTFSYKNDSLSTEEDPIQEALADFEAERVKDGEDLEEAEKDNSSDESDSEGQTRRHRLRPISGLSVLW